MERGLRGRTSKGMRKEGIRWHNVPRIEWARDEAIGIGSIRVLERKKIEHRSESLFGPVNQIVQRREREREVRGEALGLWVLELRAQRVRFRVGVRVSWKESERWVRDRRRRVGHESLELQAF